MNPLRFLLTTMVAGVIWTGLMVLVIELIPGDIGVIGGALLGFTAAPVGVAAAVWNELRH